MLPRRTTWILLPLLACLLVGCKSAAERAHDEAVKARIVEEQAKLDGVEQRRSDYSGARSCRKVITVSLEMNTVTVDKSQCSLETLKQEEDFEKQEQQERLGKAAMENFNKNKDLFDKMRREATIPSKRPEQ